jgi:hypothetical protein
MKFDKLKTAVQITGESCCEIDGKIHIAKNGVNTPITDSQQSEIDTQYASDSANYDALEYQRLRKPEYPSLEELVVALYDTDDKTDIDKRRADVKLKHPKP